MAGRKQETQLRTAGGIRYELTRKKVKNLNIRVREDGTVAVSVPLRTSAEAADRFVAERAQWVQEARERARRRAARDAQPLPDRETALAYFTAMSDKVYPHRWNCPWQHRHHSSAAYQNHSGHRQSLLYQDRKSVV